MTTGKSKRRLPFWSLGFGFEHLGLFCAGHPVIGALLLAVILGFSAVGITDLGFDQDLRTVFARSSAAGGAPVPAATGPDTDGQILVLVEGDSIAAPATFARLQDFQFELQLTEHVGSVLSLFSLREPPTGAGDPPALVTDPGVGLDAALAERIRTHPLLGEKLLSADRRTMVFVVLPAEARVPLQEYRALHTRIDEVAASTLGGLGLTTTVTGFPAVRIAVVDRLIHDQIVLNAAGAIVGLVLSFLVFRSLAAAAITAVPAFVASFFVLGMLGLFGIRISVLSNVIPILIMILGYVDGMHLSDAFRRFRNAGMSPRDAEIHAIREVGPATVLAGLTTSVAFLSLALSDVSLIKEFGWIGTFASFSAALVVLATHALCMAFGGRFWRTERGNSNLIAWLAPPTRRLARFSVNWRWPITGATVLLVVGLATLYAQLEPEHSIREHLPRSDPANAALGRVDEALGGAFPIRIVVPLGDIAAASPEGLARIAAVHQAAEAASGSRAVSLYTLVAWLGGGANPQTATGMAAFLDRLDVGERARLLGEPGEAVITVNVQEAPTRILVDRIARLEAAVQAAGGPEVRVTGSTVINARESTRAINTLSLSLYATGFGELAIISLAFFSLRIGLTAFLPNVLPILATGSLIFLFGYGLQFTSVIALIVALGVAVDDTVHYLNRAKLYGENRPLEERLIETSGHVGPVMIGSTLVLIAGLSTTFFSSLPTISLFGALVAITLVTALIGELVILPALIAGPYRRWYSSKKPPEPVAEAAPRPSS